MTSAPRRAANPPTRPRACDTRGRAPRRPARAPGLRVGALALLAVLAAAPARALTPSELFAQVAPSVWRVQTFDADELVLGQGSGVVIGPGQLVTNCHVLQRARRVQVRHEGRPAPLPARLALWDVHRDLCQLQVAGLDAPAVALAPSGAVVVGQPAYAVGHPKGLDLTLSDGLVSSLRRNDAQQLLLIQTTAAISGGNSGGGLFDDGGRLLGLTTLLLAGADAQALNFAIPADWITDLPRRHAAAQAERAASAPRAPAASGAR